MKNFINWILLLLMCAGIFLFAYLMNFSRLGAENTYGYLRMLMFNAFITTTFVLLNVGQLKRMPLFTVLIVIWIFGVLLTCLNLLKYPRPFDIAFIQPPWSNVVAGAFDVLYCPSFFLFFFVCTKKYPQKITFIMNVFMGLVFVNAYLYTRVYSHQNAAMATSKGVSVLNDAYWSVLLIPWVVIYPKKAIKIAGFAAILFVTLFSAKRTALVIVVMSGVTFLLVMKTYIRKKSNITFIIASILISAIAVQSFVYVNRKTGGTFGDRLGTMSEDKGSGRLDIVANMIPLILRSDADEFVFGHGHNSAMRFTVEKMSAHDDWLETLFDYGVIMLVLYAMMHVVLIATTYKLIKKRSYLGPPMAVSYIIFLIMSLLSHLVLYATYFSYLMAFWGIVFGMKEYPIGKFISLPKLFHNPQNMESEDYEKTLS